MCEKSGDFRNSCCYAVYCRTLEERPHTCCGQRLFEWMYVQGDELNFNLAVDDETGKIFGINGFILYNHEANPDMSGSMWKVLPNQSPALGLSLGEYSWERWQPRDVFSLGLNERAAKIEHLYGSETACLECWYRLGKNDGFKLAKLRQFRRRILMLRPEIWMHLSMDEFKQAVSDVQLKKNTPYKNYSYIEHRFLTIRFMNISFTG